MLQKLKEQALPIAIIIGVLFHNSIAILAPFIPGLVFIMLLLSFCSVSPKEMKFTRQHFLVLGIQISLSLVLYFTLLPVSRVVAQSVFICALAPTAAAAATITAMLGGRVSFEASFVFLDNVMVALAAPLFFTWFGEYQDIPFGVSVFKIGSQVIPILIFPLLLAWLSERYAGKLHKWMISVQWSTFYMWAAAIAVSAGQISKFILEQDKPDYLEELVIAFITLLLCLGQFRLGRLLGRRHHNYVGTEQALGQKNTVLAIWMAQIYLNPVAAIGPGAYHLWQSCTNSYQLYVRNKRIRNRQKRQQDRNMYK